MHVLEYFPMYGKKNHMSSIIGNTCKCMYWGKVEVFPNFWPVLYIDLQIRIDESPHPY